MPESSQKPPERGAAEALRAAVERTLQEAGAELARRGGAASGELSKRLEALEGRLASIEEQLRREPGGGSVEPDPEAEVEE